MFIFIEEACSCLTWLTGTLHHGPSSSSLSRRSFSSCTPTDTRGEKTYFFLIRQHLCKRHLHLLTSLVLPLQIIVRITRPVFKSIWLIIHVCMYVILWNTKVNGAILCFSGCLRTSRRWVCGCRWWWSTTGWPAGAASPPSSSPLSSSWLSSRKKSI